MHILTAIAAIFTVWQGISISASYRTHPGLSLTHTCVGATKACLLKSPNYNSQHSTPGAVLGLHLEGESCGVWEPVKLLDERFAGTRSHIVSFLRVPSQAVSFSMGNGINKVGFSVCCTRYRLEFTRTHELGPRCFKLNEAVDSCHLQLKLCLLFQVRVKSSVHTSKSNY